MLGSVKVLITRQTSAGDYIDGYFVDGTTEQMQISASVQPLTARELLLLPEGSRTKEWLKLYSKTELFARRDKLIEDKFTFDGRTFSVMSCKRYRVPMGLKHFMIMACEDNQSTVDKGVEA